MCNNVRVEQVNMNGTKSKVEKVCAVKGFAPGNEFPGEVGEVLWSGKTSARAERLLASLRETSEIMSWVGV